MKFRFSVMLIPLLVVGTLQAEPPKDPIARIRYQRDKTFSANSLRQIGIAWHSYHDMYATLPRDIVSPNGKPLLSWRVAILPFIEQAELYKQFDLNSAWDSEANKKLLEKMPNVYASPRKTFEKGRTFYQSFSGPGAILGEKKLTIQGIQDGSSNTFMVIEAGEPVEWTKPADVAFDPKKPLPKLGGIFDGDLNVLFCDGHRQFIPKGVKEEILKKYITIAGNEESKEDDLIPAK